jgi:hypothetical protein
MLPAVRTVSCILTALVATVSATADAQQIFTIPDEPPLRTSVYEETTSGTRTLITAREWARDGGLILHSASSTGERHTVLVDGSLETVAWRYEHAAAMTRVEAISVDGGSVRLAGDVEGSPVDGALRLGEAAWIQSIERSMRTLALRGSRGDRLRFSVVQPDNLSSRTLLAQVMGDETIEVGGADVEARRIRISLPGIGVLIWRSDYWFRLSDGLFVRSDVTRGPPGTPRTIVSLVSDTARPTSE